MKIMQTVIIGGVKIPVFEFQAVDSKCDILKWSAFAAQLCMRNIWVDDDEVIFFDRKFFILHKKIATALNDIE